MIDVVSEDDVHHSVFSDNQLLLLQAATPCEDELPREQTQHLQAQKDEDELAPLKPHAVEQEEALAD